MNDPETHRAGVVTLLGRPNVGKSTLLNRLLRFKVSIVSPRPQTTRNRFMGVLNEEGLQAAIVDTPGIGHRMVERGPFHRRMLKEAEGALDGIDVAVLLIDPGREQDPVDTAELLDLLESKGVPTLLALNKIDLMDRKLLLPVLERYGATERFASLVPISARKGHGLVQLLGEIRKLLPVSPPLFPEDMVTDVSERFLCSELIREKVFRRTGQEIPYATAVEIEKFEEVGERKLIRIFARIHVEKDSQRGILIGKGGRQIKEIGTNARMEMERLLGSKVYLDLRVSVAKNWSRLPQQINRLGHFVETDE